MTEATTVTEAAEERRRPKGRSPSYPGIPLNTAIDRARIVWERERRYQAPVSAITAAWGYKSPTSGPASVTLAALKKFGLLEEEGSGAARVVKLTELAVHILMNPQPQEAIKQAALRPSIHREMWDEYGPNLPSEDTLRYRLVVQRGFTDAGFKEFIREYRETIAFAQLTSSDTLRRQDPPVDGGDDDDAEDDGRPGEGSGRRDGGSPRGRGGVNGNVLTIPVPIIGGSPVMVEGEFPISEAAWSQFIAVLEAMKPGLVKPEDQGD